MKEPRRLIRTSSPMDKFATTPAHLLFWGFASMVIIFEGIYAEENPKGCHVFTQEVKSTTRREIIVKATKNHVLKSIELVKRLSTQPCVRSVMYGNSLVKWWVRRGCAGEFKLEECPMYDCIIRHRNGSSSHSIPRAQMATKGYYIWMMNVIEETSFYSCDHGSTFHHNETMWWLDRGCEGMFQILECPINAKSKALHVHKFSNVQRVISVPRKETADRVKLTKIPWQHVPMTTTTTTPPPTTTTTTTTPSTTTSTSTTTDSAKTTTASFKNSSFSSKMEANKILMKTPAKQTENNVNDNHTKHDWDISEANQLPMRQTATDEPKHNLANSRKADDHLMLLCIIAVLKSSHLAFGLN